MAKQVLFNVLIYNPQVRQSVAALTTEPDNPENLNQAERRANPWYSILRVILAQKQVESLQTNRITINYFLSNIKPNSAFSPTVLNLFCAIVVTGLCKDKKRRELVRVLEEIRIRLFAMNPNATKSEVDLSEDVEDYHPTHQTLEAFYDERMRTRHGARRTRSAQPRRTRDRIDEFLDQTGLSKGGAISIENLLKTIVPTMRQYAIFEEWGDPRADLISQFSLPTFVTLGGVASPESRSSGEVREIELRGDTGKRSRTLKRNRRLRTH
jgi:hypothetical protein